MSSPPAFQPIAACNWLSTHDEVQPYGCVGNENGGCSKRSVKDGNKWRKASGKVACVATWRVTAVASDSIAFLDFEQRLKSPR